MRAAAAVFALLLLTASAGARTQTTHVQIYRPFADGSFAPGLTLAKAVKGNCFSGSGADSRSDAWRCFIGNEINDPCSDAKARSGPPAPEDRSPSGRSASSG